MESDADLRQAGEQCRGLDKLLSSVHRDIDADADEPVDELRRRRELAQFGLVKGVLFFAAETLIDLLFDELTRCEAAATAGRPWEWEFEAVCGGLPGRFGSHYTPLMVRKLILASGAVTSRLTGTWSPPGSVMEELALRLLLDQAEVVIDGNAVALADGWREDLEELLFEDLDVQLLYDDPTDVGAVLLLDAVAEHYSPEGWSKPFSDRSNQAPYVTGSRSPTGPSRRG